MQQRLDTRIACALACAAAAASVVAAAACGGHASSPVTKRPADGAASDPPCQAVSLQGFVPEAARFPPGAPVRLLVDVADRSSDACTATLHLRITRRGDVIHEATQQVVVGSGGAPSTALAWDAPDDDFRGYMAEVSADASGDHLSTGVDVSSDPLHFPRYGYVATFPPGQRREQTQQMVDVLARRFHLDMFQLYDWFWRHENLIPRGPDGSVPSTWKDLFGRVDSQQTIRDVVDAAHADNAYAMAYVAMYAAREGYEQLSNVSPAWGIYRHPKAVDQVSLSFGGDRALFLFDPTNADWQARMASQYTDAVQTFGFDGVHIDQFGPYPTVYRADGSPLELRDAFAPFLESVDEKLTRNAPDHHLCVFNIVDGSVDGYGVQPVARSTACDLLYSELWYSTNTYDEVRAYVEQLRSLGHGRAVVLAVYPQYGQDIGTILQAEDAKLEGVHVASNHAGYTGSGFVDQFDREGDAITWSFDETEDATVTFVFRYANATGQRATRTVVLDGQPIGKVSFGALASWDDWSFDAWLQHRVSAGHHEVTLAYDKDDTGAINVDRMTLGEFDEDAVRLQNAVIFASGATPIQIGDDVQALAHEYFPNRSKSLTPSLQRALERQFSFITAHEDVLFPPDVVPVDARLGVVLAPSGPPLITKGTGGIWTVVRRTAAGDVVHLVNMVGLDNDLWRDAAPTPTPQTNVVIRYKPADASKVTRVLWATPDEGPGTFAPLDFRVVEGGFIELTVPRLTYWDAVLVQSG